jgi:hypothetical protein
MPPAETHLAFHVKFSLLLFDFNQIRNASKCPDELPYMKFV